MTAIKSVGVVGAGVMGSEVALVLAQSGYHVVLVDIAEEALRRAAETIARSLRFQRVFTGQAPGERAGTAAEVLERIVRTVDYDRLSAVDFVVENVTESWEIKRAVYPELDRICPPHTVFAVNTSVIPITRVASATGRAEQVIGTHFMNPPSVRPMVEVIRGFHTSDETVATTTELLSSMGKQSIVVADSPGFVSNRVLMLTVNEAIFLVHEGVASAEDVDRLFKGCFGHRMGPLETADLIGLDTILASIEGLQENFGDSKYRPCPLLAKMVAAGLHGRKNGRGFYNYTNEGQIAR